MKSNMPETCRNLLQNIDFFGGSNVDIVISNLIHAQCGAVDDMNEFICLPFSPLKKNFQPLGPPFQVGPYHPTKTRKINATSLIAG